MPKQNSAAALVAFARSELSNGPAASARALAEVYPRFRRLFSNLPWNAERLYQEAMVCSGAERNAARFVLDVWNTGAIEYLDGERVQSVVVTVPPAHLPVVNGDGVELQSSHGCVFTLKSEPEGGSVVDDGRVLGPLNIVEALGNWDDFHREAFAAWARAPWWC